MAKYALTLLACQALQVNETLSFTALLYISIKLRIAAVLK
jgi:hypothetical protein